MAANDNESWSENWAEYKAHAERMIDQALALAAEDRGDGPLHPSLVLIELASRTIARAVLEYEVDLDDAFEMVNARAAHVMLKAVEQQEATLRPALKVVE